MAKPYKPVVPETLGDILDKLSWMMLKSPTFEDDYFTDRSGDVIFSELNEGLRLQRNNLGEERYIELIAMSARMQSLFLADPDDKTGETAEGQRLILEMLNILRWRPAPPSDI